MKRFFKRLELYIILWLNNAELNLLLIEPFDNSDRIIELTKEILQTQIKIDKC